MKLLIMRGSSQYVNPSFYNVQEIGLGKELVRRGWQVRIVSSGPSDKIFSPYAGLEWVECKRVGPTKNIGWPANAMRHVRDYKPDLIQLQDVLTPTTFITLLASLSQRTRLVMSMGEYATANSQKKDTARRVISKFIRQRVSAVLCKTNVAADMCRDLGFRNVSVCPVGIDPELYDPDYTSDRLPWLTEVESRRKNGYIILSHVGRINKFDNMEFLSRMLAALPEKYVLLVAGEPVAHGNEIAERVGVGGRIIFAGSVPNSLIGAVFSQSDLYLSCSTFEPFGLSAVESLFNGCPVVAHPTGGLVDIVEDGVNGIHVKERTPEAWASAIMMAIDSGGYMRLRSLIGIRDESWTWKHRAKAYDGVYKHVLNESR